ncbi:MAG: excisionase family DNA-binding protein [Chloroflexi bacterium]|nr:excisionase family DNA-binding protein [Chloroflexota bacterium]
MPDEPKRPRLVPAEVVADAVQVSPRTILEWHRQGRIPGVRPTGSTVRFDLDEVLAALKAGPR